MVAFTPEIQALLTAITSISLYCEQLKLGSTCSILTKFYQPNKKILNVYGISNGTFNGTLLRSFNTDADLRYYYPEFQYFPSQQSLLHVLELERSSNPAYSIYTYPTNGTKYLNNLVPVPDLQYQFCFSNLNQFYCVYYAAADKTFQIYFLLDDVNHAFVSSISNFDEKLNFYTFDYCTSSLIFESDNDMYFVNLYNLVNDISQFTKIPKSEYKINFCLQDGGRFKATPMFLTSFAKAANLQSKSYEIGLIDFEICDTVAVKKHAPKITCPPGTVLKEEEEGFFENTTNIIWLIVCIIGLIADIAMIVITVVYYLKTKQPKEYKEYGTETYMGITTGQSPATTTPKNGKKGKTPPPPPPPKQLEMTTPTEQSQKSTKPQSTLLVTDY